MSDSVFYNDYKASGVSLPESVNRDYFTASLHHLRTARLEGIIEGPVVG